ncbi:hypothetical protein [Longimicrobium terrae]|uniref:Uncharacterized protein n=1 Tax=Longimicrobium terrae TaxID=1639882 RepID=A0A841H6I4_9BACT|nr:hypothetical protein [Longimicrobium terrae]MBB4639140.1 hypothetical protein [Longimicrobium terrae]MBB6073456.1 hypothetical protein [Longimicrobium terrae]NNC32556.1 hypothetical protein [Longimicrobium terrae]
MNRPALRFWASAAGVAIGFAALVPVAFPYGLVGRDAATDRDAVWLLVVFTAGMMMILFGAAALLGGRRALGVTDVVDAGSVSRALARAGKDGETAPGYVNNAAVWTVVTGALLLLIYFALWMTLR